MEPIEYQDIEQVLSKVSATDRDVLDLQFLMDKISKEHMIRTYTTYGLYRANAIRVVQDLEDIKNSGECDADYQV